MAIKGTGLDTGQVVPDLSVQGVPQAVRFFQRALGAAELFRAPVPGMAESTPNFLRWLPDLRVDTEPAEQHASQVQSVPAASTGS